MIKKLSADSVEKMKRLCCKMERTKMWAGFFKSCPHFHWRNSCGTIPCGHHICGKLKDEGKSIILASHNKEDIKVLCDEVYEMDHGKLTVSE